MKTILAMMLVSVVQTSAMSSAKPESPVGMSVVKTGSIVKLFYRGEQRGDVSVAIYDERGATIYKERLQDTRGFMRPYNFSAMPSGVYTVELTDEKGSVKRTVLYTTSNNKRVARLTRLDKGEHRYVLSVPNSGSDVLKVRIYNENNRLLYHKKERIEGDFARVYNLNTVRGRLIFEITDKNGNSNRFIQPNN